MIQRVQTLFLLGVAICMASMLFFQLWQKSDPVSGKGVIITTVFKMDVQADQPKAAQKTIMPYLLIGLLAGASVIVAFVEIFKFENRLTQIKLGALNALFMASTVGLSMYFIFQENAAFVTGTQGEYKLGIFFPLGALVCNILANRFIRRDEMLVKSVDRIR